jgi:hypothetical protein
MLKGLRSSSLESSRSTVIRAAERSAEAITDALDAYRKAAQAEGGELKRVALREEFTIVLDTSARMLYLAVAVMVLYAVLVAVGWYGSAATAVGSLLFVGAAAVLILLVVHTMLFFFARSDQKTQSEVVTFNIGQTIATRLYGIDTMRSFMRELAAFQGEFGGAGAEATGAGGEAEAASGARSSIEQFLFRMANEKPLELFGLHKIKAKRRRLRFTGGLLLIGVLCAGAAAVALSVITAQGALARKGLSGEQLALDDVAVSTDGGNSWSRGVAPSPAPSGESWLSPQGDVFHAPFGPRSEFGMAALDGGNAVVVVGGAAPQGKDARQRAAYADVWRGERVAGQGWVSWRVQNRAAPWGRRWGHQVARAGSRLVLVGGVDGDTGEVSKDVWASDDEGVSWTQQADFPGRARFHHAMASAPDRSSEGGGGRWLIVLVGGVTGGAERIENEVWRSLDGGVSWQAAGGAEARPFGEREAAALTVLPVLDRLTEPQAQELVRRIPDEADRTVGDTVLGITELRSLPSLANARITQVLDARARKMRNAWDGGNDRAPTSDSLLGRALAAGQATPEAQASDAQKAQINAMLGALTITRPGHLAAMSEAHVSALQGNDATLGDLGRKDLRDAIAALWNAPNAGVLVLTGGAPGRSDRTRGTRAPIEVFRSSDAGVTWERVEISAGSPAPTSRRGHAMVSRQQGTAESVPELVLVGGFQTVRGADLGLPLGDAWVSNDLGTSWRRVGSGAGRIEQISAAPYDIPRRAFFGLATVAAEGGPAGTLTGLLALGGEATGTPEEEREALGLIGAGMNDDRETVPDELNWGGKVQLLASAAAVLLVLGMLVALHTGFYRAQYRDIPRAYVKTEKAWREALEDVAANPERYEVPGSFARIGKSVPQALRSAGSIVRSMRSAAPPAYSRM